MCSKTNYQMLKELEKQYKPEKYGWMNAKEQELVSSILEIKYRDILDLRNLRDIVVMFYSLLTREQEKVCVTNINMDKMSAITYLIDSRIVELGGEV